ncbi:MAG: RluA family pseudouridine synthase [Candidatus Hydrogenedentes bacterium]|nr:RluA family pseudouridine synthase [Candidatus Hydrogenedentota bacterium]
MDEPKKEKKPSKRHQPRGLIILHHDKHLLVVDKAPGLLTMGTDREKEQTAYYRLTDYVRKGQAKSRERIFIVHRLDREVSGILIVARTEAVKNTLQTQWDNVEKHYLALVHGVPREPQGTFSSYIEEVGVHKVRSNTDARRGGKLSHTAYKLIATGKQMSLLDIRLLTGRKHQIRVQLAQNGLPIVGDTKYGDNRDGARRLGLHAKSIAFTHPVTGEACFFETRIPHFFARSWAVAALEGQVDQGPA